jgi:heme/copper-type cytochrome/quinol oxidase subunit 2
LGSFNDQEGNSACLHCPSNATTLQARSTGIESCVCPSGYYGQPKIYCLRCPSWKGMKCDVNSSVPFVMGGFWRSEEEPSFVQECFPHLACPETGFGEKSYCALGYTGNRCGECLKGMYRKNQICTECGDSWITWTFFSVFLVLMVSLFFYSMFASNSNVRRPLRSVFMALQTLGVLSRFIDENQNSNALSYLLLVFDFSNFNFGALVSFDCIKALSFWDSYLTVILLITFSLPVMMAIAYFISCIRSKKKSYNSASEIERSISTFLSIMSTLYTFVLSSVFKAFRCYPQDDGSYTLLSSPNLDCYDTVWFNNFGIIFISILIVVLVPCVLFWILHRNRNERYANHFHWKFGLLVQPYKPKFYYWEVVTLLLKTVLVVLVDLTNGWQKFERSFALILFLCFQIYLDIHVNPYQKGNIPILEIRVV